MTCAILRAEQDTRGDYCGFPGCGRLRGSGGATLCDTHEHQWRRTGKLQPIRQPEAPIPPCRKCGGTNFSLRSWSSRQRNLGLRLIRYCLDCSRAAAAKRRSLRPEINREATRRWREANRERFREMQRAYKAAHIEEIRAKDRARRAAKRRRSAT